MRVEDVCEIQAGYTARERLKPDPFGAPVLQLRDIGTDEAWPALEPERFDLGDVKERYFAGSGDVLFRSRGHNTTASAIPDGWPHLAVAILPLVLLKPRRDVIRPAYFAWALNQAEAQLHFDKFARGTSLRMVPKAALAGLEIAVPDLATQDAILEVARLSERAYSLELEAAGRRRTLARLQLAEAASKHHRITAGGGRA